MFLLVDFSEKDVKVKQYVREGHIVHAHISKRDLKEQKDSHILRNLLIGAGIVGITGIGLVAGLSLLRGTVMKSAKSSIIKTYDDNLKKSLQKTYQPIVKPLEHKDADIVFAINGFNGMPHEHDQYNDIAKGLDAFNKTDRKINVIPFTVKHEIGNTRNPIQMMSNLYASEKATDKVVELAETVKAYKKKYPNKKITILGFSMGGSTAINAADLLKDPSIQTISIASPNIRGVEPPNYTGTRVKNDGILPDEVFTGKEVVLDDVEGHNNAFSSRKGLDLLINKLFGH